VQYDRKSRPLAPGTVLIATLLFADPRRFLFGALLKIRLEAENERPEAEAHADFAALWHD
jgi:hypothetical protein